jgi:Holliday junction resolvase RusA-like endonuclease
MIEYTIEIPGESVGKQRPKVYPIRMKSGIITRGGVTPEKTVNYQNLVKLVWREKYPGFMPLKGPVRMELGIFKSIPKSASRKKAALMEAGEIRPETKPDWDNVGKMISDALEGLAYERDSQIASAIVEKFFSHRPLVEVKVMTIGQGLDEHRGETKEGSG